MRFLIEIKFVMQIWVYIYITILKKKSKMWDVNSELREQGTITFLFVLSCGENRLVQTDICTVSLK